ncbi:hypothetical protein ES692_10495 [Psychroserpens burtonensis]|uniref:Uncharacterized protein n=1 Tax=Psychroserpens burtonensis TaxID=49278 RepID=A0A5C7B5P4_9FLAO|nr:hypothetical protein [Psychroserpens burtonensis]TXE17081.1 hypothetical protein ES692_10495 [Psychroserpens burtonensis]
MSFITKLKSAFGNSNASKTVATQDTTDAIMKDVDNKPFAISDQNVLYAGLNELGGYFCFQTVIVGTLEVKTKKGAQLTIVGKDLNLVLKSESVEFETEATALKGRMVTKIDFQIDEKNAGKIDPLKIDELTLNCKKHEIVFTAIAHDQKQ